SACLKNLDLIPKNFITKTSVIEELLLILRRLENPKYPHDKNSDIYSISVLSSHEKPIAKTPKRYIDLYSLNQIKFFNDRNVSAIKFFEVGSQIFKHANSKMMVQFTQYWD
ncbi:35716_t:CDS:2, partial [Racocetra persica]